jgi:hypothetical protein
VSEEEVGADLVRRIGSKDSWVVARVAERIFTREGHVETRGPWKDLDWPTRVGFLERAWQSVQDIRAGEELGDLFMLADRLRASGQVGWIGMDVRDRPPRKRKKAPVRETL